MPQGTFAYYHCHFGNIFHWGAAVNVFAAAREVTGGHCG
jgi:hypothetical protein